MISATLEKDILMPGETTNLRLSVDNSQGKVNFTGIKCELIESVILVQERPNLLKRTLIALNLPGFDGKDSLPEQVVRLTLPPCSQSSANPKTLNYKGYQYSDIKKDEVS